MGATDKVRGKSDNDAPRKVTEIGLLLYPGAQTSAVSGLTDLFNVANRLSAEHGGQSAREVRATHWRVRGETDQLKPVFDTHQQLGKHEPPVTSSLVLVRLFFYPPSGFSLSRCPA